MKKLIIPLFLSVLILIGCENAMNTPTSKVEEFLGKYQKMDSVVLTELDDVIKKDDTMSEEQKENYKKLLEKQYQNLSYKIKNEEIENNTATVDVEIEVLDYKTSIINSKKYYLEHKDNFSKDKQEDDDNDNDNDDNDNLLEDAKEVIEDAIEDTKEYIDYKLEQMSMVTDKTKYEITFNLTKDDGIWTIDNLTETDRQKIHGLY